jgi:signal transduction histidine kinase/ligand-binding sensor domain-containing protein
MMAAVFPRAAPERRDGAWSSPQARRTLAILIALALPLALGGRAGALEPGQRFDQYTHAAWPSVAHATSVFAILPARDGHLWLGTSEGLVRLDGQHTTPFDSQKLPGVPDRNIRALLEAKDGTLWIGSFGQGQARLRGDRMTAPVERGGPGPYRLGFLETADGTVWASGRDGVARFPGGPADDGLPSRDTHVLVQDARGTVWAGTHEGLARWTGRTWVAERGPPDLPSASLPIDALRADPDGTLWVGTRGAGLWRRRGDTWRRYTVEDGLGSNTVSAVLRDRTGHLWVATKGAGSGTLSWLASGAEPARFAAFPLPPTMCPDRIEALAEDGEGGLWIGTELCGLHRLSNRPFVLLTTADGLPSDLVLGLAAGPGGGAEGALVGTRGGGLARWRGGRIEPLACPAGLPCDQCWDFSPSARGGDAFWTVCSTNAVLRWDGRALGRQQPLPDLPEASFAVEARDGAHWFALGERVVRVQGGVATAIAAAAPLRGYRILFEGRGGTIWIGADDGLIRWRAGQTHTFRLPSADRPAEVANFHEDAEGTLWMATKGEGIRSLRAGSDRIATVGVGQGLPTGWIVQILEDEQQRLWVSGSKGIFAVAKRELAEVAGGRSPRLQPSLYDATDGIQMWAQSFGHPAGFKDRQGKLWFATNGGIAVLDPASPALRAPAPRVVIEELRLGGQRIDLRAGAVPVLRGAARDLDLRFAASTFAPPDKVAFRYWVSRQGGYDDGESRGDWVDLGAAQTLHLAGLPPGDYQLAVQARTRDSAWGGQGQPLAFGLRPPFHRSPAFFVACAALAGLSLLLVHRLRLQRTRARLQAVLHERARIARDIHDTLAQAVVATSVQLECLDQALENEDRQTVRQHLDTAKQVVQETLDEARRSIWVLRPQALEHGLVPALQALVRRLSGGPAVELELSGTPRRLPVLAESNLLRIAGEAIANAYRHAHARHISLRLDFAPRSVRLAVVDDGSGWPAQVLPGPTAEQGLLGMKERAADVGGTFLVDSGPERGTTVRVEIPT